MIRSVQYLRGLAAMLVVWYHAATQIPSNVPFIPGEFGKYGVDLFFAISGFIMLVTTWDKPMTPVQFMRHRIRRIVPLYWLVTLTLVAAMALRSSASLTGAAVVKSLLFVPYVSLAWSGPGLLHIRPVLMQGWTLSYEMFFYVLFAALLLVNRELRLILMVGILSALVLAGNLFHPNAAPLQVYTDPRLLEFAVGMILGRLWVLKKHARKDGGNLVLLALGDASYSIYLTHTFIVGALRVMSERLLPMTATMASSIALMVLSLVACAAAGWCCYRFVERPLTAYWKAPSLRPQLIG
jgi:exopolysaccharide production protein ExoZ